MAITFAARGKTLAACACRLAYQRLDETLLLECRDEKNGGSIFSLRVEDRLFALYLAPRKTLYEGSIFVLQDSPEIESHMRPLDLLRALKPTLPRPDQTRLRLIPEGYLLEERYADLPRITKRQLRISKEGFGVRETYHTREGRRNLEIRRENFHRVRDDAGDGYFPESITLSASENTPGALLKNRKETRMTLRAISLRNDLGEKDLRLETPEGTVREKIEDPYGR